MTTATDTREDDDSERTLVSLPNTRMPLTDPSDELVHVLVPQPSGIRPVIRLVPGTQTIGRTEGADIVLPGSEVSRRHCQVDLVGVEVIAGGEVLLTDLASTNGTYVDGTRVVGTVALSPGARVSVGNHHLLYDRRGKRELDEMETLERELQRANQNVLAILPLPLREGPVRAEWYYVPCTHLGGDAFGYRDLGNGIFAGYMIDVSGEGAPSAMHAVTVANMLRQDMVLGADLRDPAKVLARLNASFPMATHDGMIFTAWYWAYQPASRTLIYGAAGTHPALLVDRASGQMVRLQIDAPVIGAGQAQFTSARARLPPGAQLYLFSDGAFGIDRRDGGRWELDDLAGAIMAPPAEGVTEAQRLYGIVREITRPGPLDDDFCIVVLTFP